MKIMQMIYDEVPSKKDVLSNNALTNNTLINNNMLTNKEMPNNKETSLSNKELLNNKEEEFHKIEALILLKENMLLNKQKELAEIYNQNKFLENVKNDYATYFQYISRQKEQQIESLKLLNDYIHGLIQSGELKKYDMEDAKLEQKKIIKEINEIKQNLNNIIGKANDINNKVKHVNE